MKQRKKLRPRKFTARMYAAVGPYHCCDVPETWDSTPKQAQHRIAYDMRSGMIDNANAQLVAAKIEYPERGKMIDALKDRIWDKLRKEGWFIATTRISFIVPKANRRMP